MPFLLDRALNVGEAKKFKTYQKRVALISAFEAELEHDTDEELRERMDELRGRAADGESLDALLPECFAIVRETGKRTIGHAPLRRPADRRDGPPRGSDRRDEDRRGKDPDRDLGGRAELARGARRQRDRPPTGHPNARACTWSR